MKVLVCWSAISGYMSACWRTFAKRSDIELFVIAFKSESELHCAPFSNEIIHGYKCELITTGDARNESLINSIIRSFKPHVVLVSGWFFQPYVKMVLSSEFLNVKVVMCMDNNRLDTWRQWLGRWFLHKYFKRVDRVFVPGERSWQLAKYLGIPEYKIKRGLYGFDYSSLSLIYQQRINCGKSWPKQFLFIGRYVFDKGIDVLLHSYSLYRKSVRDPWPLECCGSGPLSCQFSNVLGVTDSGFKQPHELSIVWLRAGVFVLPSRYDAWGVVIPEACATGLPVICTESCGSSVELVRSLINGITVPTNDPILLANGMKWMHENYERLPAMGDQGRHLAAAYSAEFWSDRLAEILKDLFFPIP